jgi:hypothetical protein
VRGYYGTSETVTTWKRETIKLGPAESSSTALQTIQESGTDGSPITYSGGWDRTAMSTQNLETWLDGVNGFGTVITGASNRSYIALSNVAVCRCTSATGSDFSYSNLSFAAVNNTSTGIVSTTNGGKTTYVVNFAVANFNNPLTLTTVSRSIVKIGKILSNGNIAISAGTYGSVEKIESISGTALVANNTGGADLVDATCANIQFDFNDNYSINATGNYQLFRLLNCLTSTNPQLANGLDGACFSQNHDNTAGNHKIFLVNALISAATDQRHTASGISWKLQPTNVSRTSARPVTLSLAKVACSANNLVTIKAWMYRNNAGLTMRLVCKGGQLAGVASDVVSALSTTNAWEEETITFTPTETGVVEITAEAWGGTTFSGWVDDMTISQA